jgi:hypothetical protein
MIRIRNITKDPNAKPITEGIRTWYHPVKMLLGACKFTTESKTNYSEGSVWCPQSAGGGTYSKCCMAKRGFLKRTRVTLRLSLSS